MKISVVIAAKNEEAMLPDCIRSVLGFSDDVVLVNDMSTDATVEVAKKYGARVFDRKLDGFSTQKNYGASKANNDWVLILDADERVSNELSDELIRLKPGGKTAGYEIKFRNHIGKKWLRHGGLYPDPHVRLYDHRRAKYGKREVHETLDVDGGVGKLNNDIIHFTYANYAEYLAKVKKYATLEAKWAEKKPSIIHPLRVFVDKYILQKGILDGAAGLISAALLAYYQMIIRREYKK